MERITLIILVVIFWTQQMYSNFTMTPEKGSLEKEHHHLGGGRGRGEGGGVLTSSNRKSGGKKSSSNVVRFTTSDLNSGIHTETRRVRREGSAASSSSTSRKENSGSSSSSSSSKEKDMSASPAVPRWFTKQAREFWKIYEDDIAMNCPEGTEEEEGCALPHETYVNFAKLSINDQTATLKHLGLPAIRARDLLLNGVSDADRQSLLLLNVDATRAKEIIEHTATLPALKLIKRGILRSPKKVLAVLAALNDKTEALNRIVPHVTTTTHGGSGDGSSSTSEKEEQHHSHHPHKQPFRPFLSWFPDADIAELLSASSALQASIAVESLSLKKLAGVFTKMLEPPSKQTNGGSSSSSSSNGGSRAKHHSSRSASSSSAAAKTIAMILEASRRSQAAKILARLNLDSQNLLFSKMDETTAEALKSRVSQISPESIEEEDEAISAAGGGGGGGAGGGEDPAFVDFAQINEAIQSVDNDIKKHEESAKSERDKLEKAGLSWRGVGW
jgi:hypothetical protein